ncbi:hypothetical protein ABN764_16340 [Paenibacillaceae sp. P-4]|uniref:hypothetical protein n=1 Tax=Paenibacillaceae bacterium P-4 TaxID=3160969 RepID=UPI0032E82DF6
MEKFFVLAILLLVTGSLSHNNMMQKQVTPKQKQISTHDHAANTGWKSSKPVTHRKY